MLEKPTGYSPEQTKESRGDEIIRNHIEDIKLYMQIYSELPFDLKEVMNSQDEYCQKDSLIVIADEKSFLGKKTSEFMIDYDELESARDGQEPPDVTIGILNREDIEFINYNYSKTKIELPPNTEWQAIVAVICDEPVFISLSLPK